MTGSSFPLPQCVKRERARPNYARGIFGKKHPRGLPDGAEGIEQEVSLLLPLGHAEAPQELREDFAVRLVEAELLVKLEKNANKKKRKEKTRLKSILLAALFSEGPAVLFWG